jgi:hypothetical protein
MPTNYEVADASKEQNPMLGLIGFVMLVVVGGVSYLISAPLTTYVTTAHVTLGATGLKLLPVLFPSDWSPLAGQLAVAFFIFLILFIVVMIILFMFMRPSTRSEMSVSVDVLRQEKAAKKKR